MLACGVCAQAQSQPAPALPTNISTHSHMERYIIELMSSSQTFREQCEKIGKATNVRISVKVVPNIIHGNRARTRFLKYGNGRMAAIVEMKLLSDYSESLGHEFEHVIEQIEGIDLKGQARDGKGIYKMYGDVYETDRALKTGKAVEQEHTRRTRR